MNYQPMDNSGLSQSYLAFQDDVQTHLDQVEQGIKTAIDGVRRKWDDSWLGSGLMSASPGAALLAHHSATNLETAFQEIWDAFSDGCGKIWNKAGQLTGDPDALFDLNQYYNDAASRLVDEKVSIQRMVRAVGKHWEGNAWISYKGLAAEQCDAIDAITSGLRTAATACMHSRKQLKDIRNGFLRALFDYARDVVDAIDEGTDVGKLLTLDIGPAVKAVADVVLTVEQLTLDLASFYDENTSADTDTWRQLNGGLSGLSANNDWPSLSMDDVGDMKDHGAWTPT